MKKLIMSIVLIFIINTINAKEKFIGKIIKGEETQDVTFLVDKKYRTGSMMESFSKIHYEVEYEDVDGNKKTVFPEDCDEIQFTDENGKLARFISLENIGYVEKYKKYTGGPKLFYELVVDGKYKLYNFYGMVTTKLTTSDMFAKGIGYHLLETETTLHVISYNGSKTEYKFIDGSKLNSNGCISPSKREISKIFSSCPTLVNKISTGEMKNKDIDKMVEFYNSSCTDIKTEEVQEVKQD